MREEKALGDCLPRVNCLQRRACLIYISLRFARDGVFVQESTNCFFANAVS